jgi:hypothetical protein
VEIRCNQSAPKFWLCKTRGKMQAFSLVIHATYIFLNRGLLMENVDVWGSKSATMNLSKVCNHHGRYLEYVLYMFNDTNISYT